MPEYKKAGEYDNAGKTGVLELNHEDSQDESSKITILKLSSDADQVFDNEAFNLCKELKSIEHFSGRVNEIRKTLKMKFPDKSVLVCMEPDGKDGESKFYYKCLWEPTVIAAKKAQPAQPKQNSLKFSVQAGEMNDPSN